MSMVVKVAARRAVYLTKQDETKGDPGYQLSFQSPIQKGDFVEGKLIPRAYAHRFKNSLLTNILLSKEALLALRVLINDKFPNE